MIVEIHGLDTERMEKAEKVLSMLGLVEITETNGLDRKICVSADTGYAEFVNTHRKVWGAKHETGMRVFLMEPGELCVTIEGPQEWVARMVISFMNQDIIYGERMGNFIDLLVKEF